MANDVYAVTVKGRIGNEFVENVLMYQDQSAVINTDPFNQASILVNGWVANVLTQYVACLSSDYMCTTVNARRVNNSGGQTFSGRPLTSGTLGTGVISGAGPLIVSPYFQAGGVTPQWRVARMFLPGIAEGSIIGNAFQAPLTAALNTLCTTLDASLNNGGETWVYGAYSRKLSTFYSVTGSNASLLIGTQRKRFRPAE
jgi:hypothetical protein